MIMGERIPKGSIVGTCLKSGGEISSGETRITIGSEVRTSETPNSTCLEPHGSGGFSKPMSPSLASPDNSEAFWSPSKPPRAPQFNETLLRKRSITRSTLLKTNSRFGEKPLDAAAVIEAEMNGLILLDEMVASPTPWSRNSVSRGSPHNTSISSIRSNSFVPRTPPVAGSPWDTSDEEEEEEEEIWKAVESFKGRNKRIKAVVVIEWLFFICISGCLVASLTVDELQNAKIRELQIWKWCVLAMVTICGLLVTNWFMHFVAFLIEKNFLLKKKVLYFVHSLKKSVQVFVWIGLVLLAWLLLFNKRLVLSKKAAEFLDHVTRTLISLLIGSFLWLLKALLFKTLAINFHVNRFFDRIQEAVFNQYVMQTLSGRPLLDGFDMVKRSPNSGRLTVRSSKKGIRAKAKKVINMEKIHQLKKEKVSAWTMKVLVDAVANSGLYTISNVLEESAHDGESEHTDMEITSEIEAIAAGIRIFRNVTHNDDKYIDEEELSKFMIKEEADLAFQLFGVSDTKQIDKKSLTEWVVKVYKSRKALVHALSDTKTAVQQLDNLVTAILVVVTIVIWLLLVGIATTKVLFFLSSQLVLTAFMFGNTSKAIFEGIIFVFVMHPFDVGDLCVIDDVQLLVEEMNILTTVFLKLNNEKVYFPNSVLATKPISNYYRSPEMGDRVDFSIDFATPAAKIGLLKDSIKVYIEENPQHWHSTHTVVIEEIEDVNNIKMALLCSHTMNYQEYLEREKRRGQLVMEIKRIFEKIGIKYNLLPLEVRLVHLG